MAKIMGTAGPARTANPPKAKPFVLKTPHDVGTTAQPKPPVSLKRIASANKQVKQPLVPLRAVQGRGPKLINLSHIQAAGRGGLHLNVPGAPTVIEFKPGTKEAAAASRAFARANPESGLERKLNSIVGTAAKTELAPAAFVLKQAGRPYHSIAAAANAAVQGKNVLKAAERGAELKDTSSFSDVLKSAGVKNKVVRAIAGGALDIGLDPLTYATFGAGGVERKALEEGTTKLASRGISAGMRVNVPFTAKTIEKATSGKASSKLLTKLSNPASRKIGEASREAVQPVAPDVTPAFRTPEQHAAIRTAERRYRAAVSTGERRIARRVQAYKHATKSFDDRKVIDAIEQNNLTGLSGEERLVARSVRQDLRRELQQKATRGIGAGRFKPSGPEDAQRYFPHVNTKEFEQGTKTERRAFSTMRPKLEQGRGIRKPIATVNAETPGLFEENISRAVGQKLAKTNRSAALHDLWQAVAATGKPLTKDTPIDFTHERVYEVKPNGLTALEDAHGGFDTKDVAGVLEGKREGHFVVLDKRSVADVERRLASSAPAESGVGRVLDRTTGRLKYASTILNPSFQPRNLLGDSINAFMGDVRGKAFIQSAKVLRVEHAKNAFEHSAESVMGGTPEHLAKLLDRKMRFPDGEITYSQLLDEARREGAIDTGQFGAELRNQLAQSAPAKLGKTYAIRGVNEYRENLVRLATYISAKMRGMSPAEAAAWSLKHHFDYADLTPTERNVLRRVFPFYTFFARNTRLQAEKLLTRPGKLATIQKLLDETAKAAGYQDYQQYAQGLTSGQAQGLPIPIKVGGVVYNAYVSPPTTDLNQLTGSPSQQFFNFANRLTFYKTIPELITNYSTFFQGQIENPQAPLVPAPSPAASLPAPVKRLLGIRTYMDKRSGKRILGWPAKVDYAFRQITPDVNTLTQLATPVPGSRGMSQKTQAISGLTGIRLAPLDETTNRINALYDQLTKATNQLDALNQRLGKQADGHYPQTPESKRLRAQIKTLNHEIGTLKTQRGDYGPGIATQQRPHSGGSFLDSHTNTGKSFLDSGTTTTKSFLDR